MKEKEIVDEIMNAKKATDLEAPLNIDNDKSKEIEAKSSELVEEDEKVLRACNPKGKFIVLELKGGRFRVVNKYKQWITSFVTQSEATILASKFNMKDPEQKVANQVRKQGVWGEEESKRL